MTNQAVGRAGTSRVRWARCTLATVAYALSVACIRTTEPDVSAPTPWEIKPAATLDDGSTYWPAAQWRTALPAQLEMDSAAMASLSRDVRSRKWSTLRSLLIVRRGYLVFNEYVDSTTPQEIQPLQTATATVTGLLVGIAAREGKLQPGDGVPQLFPEYKDLLLNNPFKSGMLVDHLLTMRSGLTFSEEDASSTSLQGLTRSSQDWLRYIFSAPMHGAVGEGWSYSSGDAIGLGGVLHAVTGEAANDYARHALFAPLGITDYTWFTGQPNGLPQMGGGLSLTAPDMARLGYLLLRKGQWGSAQIVTPAWVASMSERKSPGAVHWLRYLLDFGRMLWELPPIPGTTDFGVVAAAGIRGQWIIVVPSRDLVVVATGNAVSVEDHAAAVQLLYDVILPATR
jgi:CubicO group peptidase (beta-lactamase class C family)